MNSLSSHRQYANSIGFCAVVLALLISTPAIANERQMLYIRWTSDFIQRMESIAERIKFSVDYQGEYWAWNGGLEGLRNFCEKNIEDANDLLNEWRKIKHPAPFDGTDARLGNAAKSIVAAAESAHNYPSALGRGDGDLAESALKSTYSQLQAVHKALDDATRMFEIEKKIVYREGLSR